MPFCIVDAQWGRAGGGSDDVHGKEHGTWNMRLQLSVELIYVASWFVRLEARSCSGCLFVARVDFAWLSFLFYRRYRRSLLFTV